MSYDLIIIGAGPAGLTAGIYARSRKLRTLIIDAGEAGGQLVSLYPDKGIVNYPGCVQTQAKKLAQRMIAHARHMGSEIKENEKVIDILGSEGNFRIRTERAEYACMAVIVAIGTGLFKPRKLGIPGEEEFHNKGVYYTVPDKDRLVDKRILFIGGGNSALEMALFASEVAEEVMVAHRRDKFRADESIVEQVQASSIRMIMNAELAEIVGDGRVEKGILRIGGSSETREVPVDMIIINIGFTPEMEELEGWGIELDDTQIKVDFDMSTSRAGVFACGDIVSYPGKYKQIVTGCGEGATAANSAYKLIKNPYWA